jgi:hypothetical protein
MCNRHRPARVVQHIRVAAFAFRSGEAASSVPAWRIGEYCALIARTDETGARLAQILDFNGKMTQARHYSIPCLSLPGV